MRVIPSLIGNCNGTPHDWEIRYASPSPHPGLRYPLFLSHIVRQSKSYKNAMASFARAVPNHGPIKSVRKVAPQ